ncbi:MAG: hypothetical protein A2Z88_04040 [Omnitrophica WOR_2 bacterium GWA2_47_8]|nr:MAG: hypothetical protein A2Z88_04040 [Omnitrophica WOR_2 bacterium GWA2_47_8]
MTNTKNSPISSWAQWFDKAAATFDDPRMKIAYYKNGKTGTPYSQHAVEATHRDIFKKLAPARDASILDIGCGVGYFTKTHAKKVKLIIGSDVSLHMIRSARDLNPRGHFLVAQAYSLPFQNETFDRIFSYGVTQYLPSQPTLQKMLKEMLRLIKPHGRMLIGDILEPVHQSGRGSYNKTTQKGKRWWPKTLDHDLAKLYVSKQLFENFCKKNKLTCKFFSQHISGRAIPTPRYDVVIDCP